MFIKSVLSGTQQGAKVLDVEYLVVAGGGGGESNGGGGGGAGGYRSSVTGESSGGGASAEAVFKASFNLAYTVTVGAGGAGGIYSPTSLATDGSSSVFGSVTSVGGGKGGIPLAAGNPGGSGGGGGRGNFSGGAGTSGQGFAGGTGGDNTTPNYPSGGGGGAGEAGGDAVGSTTAGDGGDGVESLITGTATYRAGGGGGNRNGAGGLGGGGSAAGTGGSGTVNTGSGGGAGDNLTLPHNGGAGGSGVVILRVPNTVTADFSAGVVYNYIPVDGFHVYEVTAAGVSDTVTFIDNGPDAVTINDSLRFNDDDSAYLSRTPASAGNRKTWTWSGWVKRGNLGGYQDIFTQASGAASDTEKFNLRFNFDKISVDAYSFNFLVTTPIFRDPSSWYHVVCVFDTTAAQAADRVKIYVNGQQVSDFDTRNNPTLNTDYGVNMTTTHRIGSNSFVLGQYLDGYLSDVYFIDGEALDPSYFGRMSSDGIWEPIAYAGTSYGTNGFHLDFADNSTAAALGTDVSGNGNNWTPSGITTDDQVPDSPSNNFATLNPLAQGNSTTLSEGNLNFTSSTTYALVSGTIGVKSGKWYWEALIGNTGTGNQVGLTNVNTSPDTYMGIGMDFGYGITGIIYGPNDTTSQSGLTTSTTGDIIGVAMDLDAAEVKFYKNNSLIATVTSVDTSVDRFPAAADNSSGNQPDITANFGQDSSFAGNKTRQGNTDANGRGDFYYTPPSGYLALCTANLPAPAITDGKEHFKPLLYTGNGATQSVQGLEFQPDFVWIKNRSAADNHKLLDAVRGATEEIESNTLDVETTNADGLTAFDSNGFTVGADLEYNTSGENFVAWNWNAGGSTVTNTDGSITSQVRANTDAGFSIVSWTGNGLASQTIGHGLGVRPAVIIHRDRDRLDAWLSWHQSLPSGYYIQLSQSNPAFNNVDVWPSAGITSSVITTTANATPFNNYNGERHIAYCFADVDGFSKFGSYTGNGSTDGPFVYTGFRPAFVMVKRTDSTGSWVMRDGKRDPYNVVEEALFADLSNSTTFAWYNDFLSNGFKIRTAEAWENASGGTYIYMAFAENPFKTARAR